MTDTDRGVREGLLCIDSTLSTWAIVREVCHTGHAYYIYSIESISEECPGLLTTIPTGMSCSWVDGPCLTTGFFSGYSGFFSS